MDQTLLLWINQGWAHPWLDVLFSWLSDRSTFSFPLLALILALCIRSYAWDGLRLWLALIMVVIAVDSLGNLMKYYLEQPRPCYTIYELLHLSSGRCGAQLNGMPSNHALNFFAAASFMSWVTRSRGWALSLFTIALLVMISRVYLGKHYPSQVLSGALGGLALGYLAAWIGLTYVNFIRRVRAQPNSRIDYDLHT